MELSHRAVSSEVSGHCLAFTSSTPKAQAGCPRAGGGVARPRAPPPGPKDPLHRDAQRPASPPCSAAPPASLESFEKSQPVPPPLHRGRRFCVWPTAPSVAWQRGSAQHLGAHLKELSNQEGWQFCICQLWISSPTRRTQADSLKCACAHLKDSYS